MPGRRKTGTLRPAADKSLAVLLIDMQKKHVDLLAKSTVPRLVRAQRKILRACAARDILLVVCELINDGPTISQLQEEICLVPRVIISTKHGDSAFSEVELHQDLKNLGIDTLVLMGINASSCVLDTADSALELKYKVCTSGSLVADWANHADHQKSWYLFQDMGADFYSDIELI